MRNVAFALALCILPLTLRAQTNSDGTADGPYERVDLFPNATQFHQSFIARGDLLTRFDIWYWGGTSDGSPIRPHAALRFTLWEGTAADVWNESNRLFTTRLEPLNDGRYSLPFLEPIAVVSGGGYVMQIISDDCGFIGVSVWCPPITGIQQNPTLAVSVAGGADLYSDGYYWSNVGPQSAGRDILFYAEYAVVSEPASAGLLAFSGALLVGRARRRRLLNGGLTK